MKFTIILFTISTFIITEALAASQITSFHQVDKKEWDFSRRSYHRMNFQKSKEEVEAFNAEPGHTYKKGLNAHSYMDAQDFIDMKCKTRVPEELIAKIRNQTAEDKLDVTELADSYYNAELNAIDSIDYSNLMQPVLQQGGCGACWSFASMGAVEALLKKKNTPLPEGAHLSPQYLIDCNTATQRGCQGGWPTKALKYLQGDESQNEAPRVIDYPYLEKQDTCNRFAPKLPLNMTKPGEKYYKGNETTLQAHVAAHGPTITVMSATANLKAYASGIFQDDACEKPGPHQCEAVTHAVIVVGFGTDPVYGDYWKIKNSFGPTWGEDGYFRLARNKGNMCGIACWAINAF